MKVQKGPLASSGQFAVRFAEGKDGKLVVDEKPVAVPKEAIATAKEYVGLGYLSEFVAAKPTPKEAV